MFKALKSILTPAVTTPEEMERRRREWEKIRHDEELEKVKAELPPSATHVTYLGNGWCTFQLEDKPSGKGRKYLFRYEFSVGHSLAYGSSCITLISEWSIL